LFFSLRSIEEEGEKYANDEYDGLHRIDPLTM